MMYERLTRRLRRMAESPHLISNQSDKDQIAFAAHVIEKHLQKVAAPAPRVSGPIIFKAQKEGPEQVVRPCSRDHRALWLSGYIVLSCSKCIGSVTQLKQAADG